MNHSLNEMLNAHWLRPETALWRCIDIEAMKHFNFLSPSLDFGCGDGTFSFIRAGGSLDITFDAFQSISNLDQYFNNVDIFDSYDATARPVVKRRPNYLIDCAFDHKVNLLRKAKLLGLYKNFLVGDGNEGLPIKDNTFNSIFSNMIYWLNSPSDAFREMARILKPGGRLCTMLPNSSFPEFSYYYNLCIKQKNPSFQFLDKLDRGRLSEIIRHSKSSQEWLKIIADAGFKVISHDRHLSKTVVQIWDIGLRPLFPILYKMASSLEHSKLIEMKKEWIEILKMFLEPIIKLDPELNQGQEPAFHIFILEKQLTC
jgi:SAM-dependent methyltransferase